MSRWTRARRKTRWACSYPITAALDILLKEQLVEHERLKTGGRIVPHVFHRNGRRIKNFTSAWSVARTAAFPVVCATTAEGQSSGIWNVRGATVSGDGDGRSQDGVDLPAARDCRCRDAPGGGEKIDQAATGTIAGTGVADVPKTGATKSA